MTSSSSGTLIIVVNPYGPFYPTLVVGAANSFIPWLAVSQSTINQPYNGATISQGCFNNNIASFT